MEFSHILKEMKNKGGIIMFKKLFEQYGYSVEEFGRSFIAEDGIFCIPFTEFGETFPMISAVSFLSCDKEKIKEDYADCKDRIGHELFSDFMNDILAYTHIGGICNHDLSLGEVENWLARCAN